MMQSGGLTGRDGRVAGVSVFVGTDTLLRFGDRAEVAEVIVRVTARKQVAINVAACVKVVIVLEI